MSQNQSMKFPADIERKALDLSGYLGSLYDTRQERILKGDRTVIRGSMRYLRSSLCEVINGSTQTGFNLLEIIGIDDELRISLLLKVAKRVGIASIMNCSRFVNEWTRILCYSYIDRQEEVIDIEDVSKMIESSDPQRYATHVITAIDFGIDLAVVLQLTPTANSTVNIDDILKKVCIYLGNDRNSSIVPIKDEEISFLERNTRITAYSNSATFTNLTRISEILHYVNRHKNSHSCQPINYHLRSTKQLHPQYKATVRKISPALINKIEQSLLQFRNPIQHLEAFFEHHTPKSIYGYFVDRFHQAKAQRSSLKDRYVKVVGLLSQLVAGLRSGQYNTPAVHSVLHDKELITLKISIDQLVQDVSKSEEQSSSMTQSRQQPLNYYKPVEWHSHENATTVSIDRMLENDNRCDQNFVDNHVFDNNNDSKREVSDQTLVDENRKDCNSPPTSMQSLYPFAQLQRVMSSSDSVNYNENQSSQGTLSPVDIPPTPVLTEASSTTTDQIINILLLGETGVGKSTFINAFVNYLSFDTFEQAESNKPVVLIPVSFLMTVGDNFEERIVKFGDDDSSKNEDFDHPGQSVTQHCKSYIFYLNDGKKLCIIDTPGFGDTRGIDQDDCNMKNILEYINNLSHLNAICFLLKPNTSRLNVFFRSCLTQLFDLLGPSISKNVAFCFTNSRATFYNPGDTAPLLKKMLKSLSIQNIPFEKENTFCFDSESFRYLVALGAEIPFNEDDRREYATSWSTSVKESNRLTDYIRMKLILYPKQDQWQSIKHAQFEIMYMIRPMLEAMRNILRNDILQKSRAQRKSIELCPTVIHRSASLCLLCQQEKTKIDNFWIVQDCPHEFQNTCLHCSHSPEHHIRIDYMLHYKSMDSSKNYSQNNMNDTFNQLREASATFAYFLVYINQSTNEDLFEAGLTRMIVQENDLCDRRNSNDSNWELSKQLMKLQEKHEQNINRMKSNQEQIPLGNIYDLMNTVRQLSIIKTQMDAVNRGREIMMKQHENEHQEI